MIKFNRFSLITGGSSAVGKDYVRLLQCIKFEIKNCITPQILELYNTSNSCIRLKAFEAYLLKKYSCAQKNKCSYIFFKAGTNCKGFFVIIE